MIGDSWATTDLTLVAWHLGIRDAHEFARLPYTREELAVALGLPEHPQTSLFDCVYEAYEQGLADYATAIVR